jgi:hypothetical protein
MKKDGRGKRVSWREGERNVSECEEERESYVEFVCEIESEEKKERSLEWMRDKDIETNVCWDKRKSRRERMI